MRVAILNWSQGANDPFSYFSAQLRDRLNEIGHDAHVVPLDERFGRALTDLHEAGRVHLAFAWQGLGSDVRPRSGDRTVWELLNIPLVCLHGDHPCYNPNNHKASSAHLFHLYTSQAFARDANRLIRREWPAMMDSIPNFFGTPSPPPSRAGDFFVFPKNLVDVDALKRSWRANYDAAACAFLCDGAAAIEAAFRQGSPRDHLEVMLDVLPSPIPEVVRAGEADAETAQVVFGVARELDRVYRNVAAAFVLEALHDVPIRINGSGWERHAARANPNHVFQPFGRLADGATQFHSAYGILDVAQVADTLHDRTLRAMRIGTGVLAATAWRAGEPIHDGFSDLFFSGRAGDLAAKAAEVMRDPEAHRSRVAAFGQVYDAVFPLVDFLARLRGHAEARGFRLP